MVNGFLANVVYYDVFKAPDEVEQNLDAKRLELDALLRTSDIVTLHTPLTESSRGLINSKSLQSMKRNAILINTARGAAVVEKDLIDALEKGIIAGAGLDVFEKEPLAKDSPLWNHPKVKITPHIASLTYPKESTRQVLKCFSQLEKGLPLKNQVSRKKMY